MTFNFKDSIWFVGIIVAMGVTWGMMSQRVTALEQDVDKMEKIIILFTKMETRIAVIETEVKNINKKLDAMTR
tara:strand:+ start:411 stop:629 length:219 start_codon:yes stop_codon:yes gene_type:complete